MQESIYWTWWLNTPLPRPTEAKKAAEKSFCPHPEQFHLLGSVHSASRHRAVCLDKHPSKSVLSLAELLHEEAYWSSHLVRLDQEDRIDFIKVSHRAPAAEEMKLQARSLEKEVQLHYEPVKYGDAT